MENYFNYFTEIEERFQKRRGTILLLSTLDWALIETWKDAGIPLEAVLRGIEAAFDSYENRPSSARKVNSLAYCAQEVLAAAEEMKEATVGTVRRLGKGQGRGLEVAEIVSFLQKNAAQLESANLPSRKGMSAEIQARESADTLKSLAAELSAKGDPGRSRGTGTPPDGIGGEVICGTPCGDP